MPRRLVPQYVEIVCNRCGFKSEHPVPGPTPAIRLAPDDDDEDGDAIELCPQCKSDFRRWLASPAVLEGPHPNLIGKRF